MVKHQNLHELNLLRIMGIVMEIEQNKKSKFVNLLIFFNAPFCHFVWKTI